MIFLYLTNLKTVKKREEYEREDRIISVQNNQIKYLLGLNENLIRKNSWNSQDLINDEYDINIQTLNEKNKIDSFNNFNNVKKFIYFLRKNLGLFLTIMGKE